jgi:large subunit ribosomal protein L29
MAKKNPAFEELVAMDAVRLARELEDTYRQLFTLRLQIATRQLSNVKEVDRTKKKIARIKTLLRQRELIAMGGNA